jgi:uncharacterized membrane protein YoaK (UPF0700 family)
MIMSKGVLGNEQRPLRVRDWLLMALKVSSGAVDAISYLTLGKIFTAFMTGNFVFLGLQMAGASSHSLVSLAVALALFAAGVLLAARIVKPSTTRRSLRATPGLLVRIPIVRLQDCYSISRSCHAPIVGSESDRR